MTNMSKVLMLASLFLLIGCSVTSIEVSDIELLKFKIDKKEQVNYGHVFRGEVIAKMKDGSARNVTKHPNLEVSSNVLSHIEEQSYLIQARPESFSDTSYKVKMSIKDEFTSLWYEDEIALNYKGSINVMAATTRGQDGMAAMKGGNTLFKRDGADGKKGENGADGGCGDNYTIYIWQESNETRLTIEDDSTGVVWFYKSKACDSIVIDLSGGDGGNGGNGGEGGDGKDGKKPEKGGKLPGHGGDGGDGGDAGSGGDGGSVIVFIHPNAKHLKKKLSILLEGGMAGSPGIAGMGGLPGKNHKAQKRGRIGKPGQTGEEGEDGQDGPQPVISVISFSLKE